MEIADECLIQCKGNYFHAYYEAMILHLFSCLFSTRLIKIYNFYTIIKNLYSTHKYMLLTHIAEVYVICMTISHHLSIIHIHDVSHNDAIYSADIRN